MIRRWMNRPSRFGDTAIVLFLLAQAADGAFTYIGVSKLGLSAEANPLILTLMVTIGAAPALLGAKLLATVCGISLHLLGVHRIVAFLTAVYMAGAVAPWAGLLSIH